MILAADIGGTTCKLGIVDNDLNIIKKWEIVTNTEDNGTHILKNVYDSFVKHLETVNLKIEDCAGVGLGVPGPVDFESGTINGAINLNWHGKINIKSQFETLSGLPVYVDNDANVATLGEKFKGAGRNEADVVCVTLGTGVGGGAISNHQLVHGATGAAGEFGHITVDTKQRFACNCGKRGCLETVASATGVVNLTYYYYEELQFETVLKDAIQEKSLQAKMVFDAAKDGDEFALYVIKKVAKHLAFAFSIISVMTNPKYIIIGGGVSRAGQFLVDHIETYYKTMTFAPAAESTKIVTAALGNDAGMIGAAGLIKTYVMEGNK
ncbi:ROK family glucokinase [Macrococcus armenti]|uniref:ROK family glucokinase n=1 Tax=Macrococcus armenti TaxID=2875764 RepID=UPI001CCE4B71|nr:ROK family glucokinase [Macrococcus armenti]UBH07696.1 ROK family glucokinase [Macrococcus armenti]UBH09931.1 ROK family glucokinase [Macrococcus armenti]UBH14479.1 ROK family glucokinase [Macrococcus armenti]UBH16840.1 ROK family glucokinase [Macrococcus armenti]UBH19102.1 ROK family glucokinase [Macrococcus armenti]